MITQRPERLQRPPLTRGVVRRILFLTTFTVIWLYFIFDLLSRFLPHNSRIVRLMFESVPDHPVVRTLVFLLFYLLILLFYGTIIDYINRRPSSILYRMSDMRGMSVPYLSLGLLCVVVLILAYEFDRFEYSMTLLLLVATFTWLFIAIPAHWSIRGFFRAIRDGFFRFMARLPRIGRYFRFPLPPSGGYGVTRGEGTTTSATPQMRGTESQSRSESGGIPEPPATPTTATPQMSDSRPGLSEAAAPESVSKEPSSSEGTSVLPT
jgi:hypothetical protein